MEHNDYRVIVENDNSLFSSKVQLAMIEGWMLVGGVSLSFSGIQPVFAQAMSRRLAAEDIQKQTQERIELLTTKLAASKK